MLRKTAKLHTNNAPHCSEKLRKRNADSSKSLNRCAIQYEVSVRASHLPKHSRFVLATAGETFKLSEPQSVRGVRNLYSAIVPLLCPRKTPCFKVFARPFSKGRVPLSAYPSPRTPLRVPRAQASFSRAASFTQTQSTEAATAISSAVGKVGAIRRLRSRGSFL